MFKALVFATLGGLSVLFGSFYEENPQPDKERVIQSAVMGILNQYHYSPEDIDDAFSAEAFDLFLEYVDSRKRFFTKEDLGRLSVYEFQIDDQIQSNSFEFFNMATSILEDRVSDVGKIYPDILEKPFDFTLEERFEFDSDKKDWPLNEEELRDTWRLQLKYDVLVALTNRLEKQEKANRQLNADDADELDPSEAQELSDLVKKTFSDLEEEAREKVLKDYDKWYKSFQKVRRSDRFEAYVNTMAHMFDPHSDYFNPKEKEDFDISIGGKLEGIGARLRSEGDLTKIVSIVPGGPVWKSKKIEVNDLILKVAQRGNDPMDVFGMRIDDVVSKIRGKKGTYVTLTIQKKDGSTIEVELERDVINIEESFAKSAMLDLDGVIDNIGYIDLPKFYSSFEGPEGNSCAADVAEEIEKLKANNVNGIILDLRGNGGGSLKDVVDMTGLFIEEGPIVQVKPKARRPYVYKDEDPEVQWDGPLIIMINSLSASASEIIAAAMQDYNRAVIVGSQSFGKGTVQRFIDLDRAVKGNSDFKPLGQLKLTMQKFYRVNGGSTQLKGVTPDVQLPDRYRLIEVGEREYANAMEWSQLSSVPFEQEVFQISNKDQLARNSSARVSKNEIFAELYDQGAWYKESRDKTSYSLNLDQHQSYLENKKKKSERFKDLMSETIETLDIRNLPQDQSSIEFDDTTIARNDSWKENLNKDIYLEETLAIMRDLIEGKSYTAIRDRSE